MKIQFFLWFLLLLPTLAFAQVIRTDPFPTDSLPPAARKVDSADQKLENKKLNIYSPRQAAIRSAILPGLGQIYNKKYWKLPIVYGALGISGSVFVYNYKWYKRTRFAYKVLFAKDTARYPRVYRDLQFLIERNDLTSLQYARDQYRRDIDYSALFFLLLWGLNVVDATVDAHLKGFDVSPDITFRIKPGFSDMAGTNGISFVLGLGAHRPPTLLKSRF